MNKTSYNKQWCDNEEWLPLERSELHALPTRIDNNTERQHLPYINSDTYINGDTDRMRLDEGESNLEAGETEKGPYSKTCFIARNCLWRIAKVLVPILILMSYIVYIGFAVYFDPGGAIFVSCVSPLVLYIFLNKLTNNFISKKGGQAVKAITKCLKPRKNAALWIRRYLCILIGPRREKTCLLGFRKS